jgi:hypothetical protein
MNKDLTEIAFILDRSGSMGAIARDAIGGFNQFLADQQGAPGQARLTVALFDDEYELHVDQVPIAETLPLDGTTYVPRGSTALLDAIGRTIDAIGKRLAATPEDQRPGKVIVAIFTEARRMLLRNIRGVRCRGGSATSGRSMDGSFCSSARIRTQSRPARNCASRRRTPRAGRQTRRGQRRAMPHFHGRREACGP